MVLSEARLQQLRRIADIVWREPFHERTWRELLYFSLSIPLLGASLAALAAAAFVGVPLAIVFVGLVILAGAIRAARGIGAFHRAVARSVLGEEIEEPPPFQPRPGFFGWLTSAGLDRAGWRSIAYLVVKAPLWAAGVWLALALWIDAFSCITYPFWAGRSDPGLVGEPRNLFNGWIGSGGGGPGESFYVFLLGLACFFAAPWATRLVVYFDRRLMQFFLGPDPVTVRMRKLEADRAHTVDTSAATLRRIERDLHDGTQAQLVALAMRLGQAKEKLACPGGTGLEDARRLVDEAHRGAKDAIAELRDLVRGIHPPALDVGLEGALSTLAARSTVPTEVSVSVHDRPTPAIEAIAYFCVAELLANVAQHARASRAVVSCAQHGPWLRVVVRDDGTGGARPPDAGSSSSGLTGLTDRVGGVDGHMHVVSPAGGPTVVTIDLPLHA